MIRQYQNVSIYDGRDACSTNSWKVDDYEAGSDNDDPLITHIIPGLKPFTQYALYIKTYTIASPSFTEGAQSPIIYFKTQQDSENQMIIFRYLLKSVDISYVYILYEMKQLLKN